MVPQALPTGPPTWPTPSPADDASGVARVLLVEDGAGDADLMREYLAEPPPVAAPASVACVTRFDHAIASLRAERFDVVLLDLMLPDASGIEALEAVVATAGDVPVVVTTGLPDERLAARAVRAGARDFLIKGDGDVDRVRRAVRSAVERDGVERGRSAATDGGR